MVEQRSISCTNCGEMLVEESSYCAACGQRTMLGRLSIKALISEFFSSVFNLDAPFPKTLSKMFFTPHHIIKGFIDGKRKSFYAPVKYMVLCLFLNILIAELLGFDPLENQRSIDTGTMNERSLQAYKAGEFLNRNLNLFLFILPFSISFFSKLFFWRSRFNFPERAAMGFYLAGQFMVISLIPMLLSMWIPSLFYLMFPIVIFYFIFSFFKVFEMRPRFGRLILSCFTAFFSFLFYYLTAYIIAYFIIIYHLA